MSRRSFFRTGVKRQGTRGKGHGPILLVTGVPKKSKTFWGALFLCSLSFVLCSSIAGAEDKPLETKGPVTITSSSLTADNIAHTALFEGSVIAKTDTMTIYADRMLVYYTDKGKIIRIEADGHVRVVRGERVITSGAATYFADDEKVVFTGQPKAVEGKSMVSGTKMIYMMKEDRSIVENSKVFIEREATKGR